MNGRTSAVGTRTVLFVVGAPGSGVEAWVEGMRAAAGMAVTRRVQVEVCLEGIARAIGMAGNTPEWAERSRAQHLELLLESGARVWVMGAPGGRPVSCSVLWPGVQLLEPGEFARRCAASATVVRF